MVHRIIIHCLLWFSLLDLYAEASQCPETGTMAMAALNTGVQGVAATALRVDEDEKTTCFHIENDHSCSAEESAYEAFMLPAFEKTVKRLDTSNPEDARLPPQHACEVSLQLPSETENPLRLPTETENPLRLPTEKEDQPMQGDVGSDFGAELVKGSHRPGSGAPSLGHNSIPLLESAAEVDVCLKEEDSARGDFQAPAATTVWEIVGDNLENIDSSHLMSILSKGSGRPGSGSSSKNHN